MSDKPQAKLASELKTIRDFLRYAITQFNRHECFYGHGTDNAWDEAVFLILRSVLLPPDADDWLLDARLTLEERQRLLRLIQRRVEDKIPSAYLLNEAWFAGESYFVNERVLIPRSPIAELIEQHFSPWLVQSPQRILDLCTGSGCIAIACAKAFPDAQVDAIDLSEQALAVAKINVERHKVGDQVQLIQSDLFQNASGKYDLIVSNPPYVGAEEIASLPQEYQHEPTIGFAGGDADGLALVETMLSQYKDYLNPNGVLIVEVGNSHEDLVKRHPELPFVWLEFDFGGHGVFLLEQ